MSEKPLISCIVPVYNGERFLSEALDSMLSQTHSPIEVIVVDDGSTDGTPQVVARYGDRVRSIRQENAGPVIARNTGLGAAKGRFIAFLDADDKWSPDKLERQVAFLQANPQVDACVTHVQNFWEEELASEQEAFKEHKRGRPIPGYVTQTLLARREAFEKVGEFNTELAHGDSADWFLRARELGVEIALMPDVLVHRRMHEANISRKDAQESRDEFLAIVKRSLDRRRTAPGHEETAED
jgi:glycosyltransferase involved in cell wall biosynthesis